MSTLSLAGKVAIVTGSSRGIGAATALELGKRGAKVVITFVRPSSEKLADDLVAKIKGFNNGADAIKVQADMASLDSPRVIVDQTVAAFGSSIDILVNNAGVEIMKPLANATLEDYDKIMNVNVRGTIFLTRAVIPHLRAPGRIINIGSIVGRIGFPATTVYTASKGALDAMTRCWAAEFGAFGHTVNSVNPGPTETDMFDDIVTNAGEGGSRVVEFQKSVTPLEHRLATAEDIALTIAMVAEPSCRWITGQCIQASGGMHMN
ncbi:uncharacterized protein L3040_006768 [Drepanopeziza brunnea f. sp. 'multigermtubi']|uniref:3-ketoacyl-acyl carrier protein reductase n=1 Tax=Marssonina brunnea f. sp. multigermtubi (strain MB_m1) TaxID=1072389 RepID=K1X060_MARBU|nr:3-ketoacyl-acyl carrier protein reductase [Drepanopeziza brunnea f. sp. 'multigermtubi' MB_m1]EKD18357.1 3-ketoacyl-acyl carrier protein reductase [Drepanopeziza brunnea f. sp. 'multigermtubi' MB_m1]KAJ5039098.1 hypothetical protein L3040_006768 [Drepanopeziza brunnea f. sp. 'multigermtubi']